MGPVVGRPDHLQRRAPRLVSPGVHNFRLGHGKCRVLDDRIADAVDLLVGPEPERVVGTLGRGVDPTPFITAEGKLLLVLGNEVLADLGADRLKKIPQVAQDRKVVNDRPAWLPDVINCHCDNDRRHYRNHRPNRVCNYPVHVSSSVATSRVSQSALRCRRTR